MKKILTSVLAAAAMFAVAGTAQAALETKGEFRARAWYLDNYLADKHSTEFWDQRLRLFMTWPVAENVKVQVRADILEGFWGDATQIPSYDPALDPITGAPTVTKTLLDTVTKKDVSFDWANLQFAWPGTPLTFTVGRQDVGWGLGLAAMADFRDRFKVAGKFGDFNVVYAFDKFVEVFQLHDEVDDVTGQSPDDSYGHVLGVTTTMAGFNGGVLAVYSNNGTDSAVDITRYLFDVYAKGKVGPADVKAEITYVIGENDQVNGPTLDATGFGAYAGVSAPAGPVSVGLEGIFVQGDAKADNDIKNAFRADYHSPFWSVILFNNMDYPGFKSETNTSGDAGVQNAMAGKLSVTATPMKALTIYGAALYAARDEVAAGVDDAMGTELDLIATYAITDAVSLTVGGGYLIAGDFYGDVDDPWGAVAAFKVNF